MNCTEIDELMPLFVGGDLDAGEHVSVASHLVACSECRVCEGHYRDTMLMIATQDAPQFSDAVYAGMRARVLSEIDAHKPSLLAGFAALVRPHAKLAIASVLILLAATILLNRLGTVSEPPGAVATRLLSAPIVPDLLSEPGALRTGLRRAVPSNTRPTQTTVGRPSERRPAASRRRRERSIYTTSTAITPDAAAVAALSPGTTEAQPPMRVEMQTKDPNIRIIWFSKSLD
ncbi:MAG: zf-HC2 domain-containing protein [Pyrinomonadaceae bacterium]